MVSIRKFRIIVLISNWVEYWSNYSIWNFEYSHSTSNFCRGKVWKTTAATVYNVKMWCLDCTGFVWWLVVGDTVLLEYDMERVMELLETRCYDGLQDAMKTTQGIGIEYDEDVVCDICRSVGTRSHSVLNP